MSLCYCNFNLYVFLLSPVPLSLSVLAVEIMAPKVIGRINAELPNNFALADKTQCAVWDCPKKKGINCKWYKVHLSIADKFKGRITKQLKNRWRVRRWERDISLAEVIIYIFLNRFVLLEFKSYEVPTGLSHLFSGVIVNPQILGICGHLYGIEVPVQELDCRQCSDEKLPL